MSRFIDDVIEFGSIVTPNTGLKPEFEGEEKLSERLKQIPVIDITNVEKYVADQVEAGKERFDTNTDFPYWMPPFQECWIEYKSRHPQIPRVAALIAGRKIEEQDPITDHPEEAIYVYVSNVICDLNRRPVWSGSFRWFVGKQGEKVGELQSIVPGDGGQNEASPSEREEIGEFASSLMIPVVMGISFMNCKNVKLIENPQSRKVQQARTRKGKEPLVVYRTLEIAPVRRILRDEGGIEGNGVKKAFHICRGHFSEYTEAKPLFGKVSGRFWIPAHTRGSRAEGEVRKDYKIGERKEMKS